MIFTTLIRTFLSIPLCLPLAGVLLGWLSLFELNRLDTGGAEDCIKSLYAAPANVWGTPVTIQNCFGEKVGCKFYQGETPIEAPIRYQVQLNNGNWQEYREGDFVYGQDIKARAASTLTGGYVKIRCECSCPCD